MGYLSTRRNGMRLELLTSRLASVDPKLLEGTTARQNETALVVTDANLGQARALVAHAAAS